MSASEHLSPRLFHGTAYYFSEGEKVEPTQETHPLEGKYAFATTEMSDAQHWAAQAAQREGKMFGPVYEVESPDSMRHPHGISIHVSKTGFTPKKVVGWGVNPDIQ